MGIPRAQSFLKRLFSLSVPTNSALQHLKKRSLIEVKGPDVSEFLQGLITNDINHLSNGVGSMFTMFLNTKGRILYDALIYKTEDQNVYWIECDSEANVALQKHLKIYKVKRKVNIASLDSHRIYALYNLNIARQEKARDVHVLNEQYNKSDFPENSTDIKMYQNLYIFKDPRVTELGFRIISKDNVDIKNSLESIVKCEISENYKKLRYLLGVGEGIDDLPIGNSNPLECNCDYLHGVSFHKGCYIGQELTARTHHTGVIRKRLMPLLFTKVPTNMPENNVILHNNVNLGKLRGIEGAVGLALIRITKALEFNVITVGDGEAKVLKPEWWPIELPKEKLNVQVPTKL